MEHEIYHSSGLRPKTHNECSVHLGSNHLFITDGEKGRIAYLGSNLFVMDGEKGMRKR